MCLFSPAGLRNLFLGWPCSLHHHQLVTPTSTLKAAGSKALRWCLLPFPNVAVVSSTSNELGDSNPCPRCPHHEGQDLEQ